MTVPANAPILTTARMRAAELAMTTEGVSLGELMERAGVALADLLWRMAAGRAVLILCGPGNNGGDGYTAARLLMERGANVRVAANSEPSTDLARAAAERWNGPVERLNAATVGAPILVDALFGVGLTRPMVPEIVAILGRLAQDADRRVAVDVPSGVASDTGACLSPVPDFDVTVALGALKPTHVLLPAAARCGKVIVAPLGIGANTHWRTSLPYEDVIPEPMAHKYSRGQVLVVAGPMVGAAALAAAAALRAGAGHCLLSGTDARERAVVTDLLSLAERLNDRRVGAVVIGPGTAAGPTLNEAVRLAVASGKALVLDAAAIDVGIDALHSAAMLHPSTILTPHSGEFDRVFGASGGSKIDRTLAAARATDSVVVHKGADTIVAAPDGRICAAWPGSPHLASAGTGDVLAGACAAMLASGLAPFEAACRAIAWHIAAARRVGAGLIADDLVMMR